VHVSHEERGDKESLKACTHLKSCESLYTCPRAPFIWRRRDFYIPRIPSNLEIIPSVDTYMNVFYIPWFVGLISYIHKHAPSSHFKPRLLRWRLWLGFYQILEALSPKINIHQDSRSEVFLDSWTSQVHGHACPETDNKLANRNQFNHYFRVSLEG
jgi:hypothetical protein